MISLDMPSKPTAPLSFTEPQCNSKTTEECTHEQSRPLKFQRMTPTVPLKEPSDVTLLLPLIESGPSASITGPRSLARYFLDICAGRDAPLSVAAIKAGLAVLVPLDAYLLLGGEAHDLTNSDVVDHILRLAWSGSVGFAVGAPPRSDQQAEILADLDPLQLVDSQTNNLIHQNVIAILTRVHASGGHVLWINPPSSAAISLNFVQVLLSNIATCWIWVDACQFDANEAKTWLFASSSPGLLPLASQCNRAHQCKDRRHPRKADHHTKFPPALCAKFAQLIVSFCRSRFSGTFHALD